MKIEWLITNATSVGPPARAEHDILGMILDVIRPVQPAIVVKEPLCDMEIHS